MLTVYYRVTLFLIGVMLLIYSFNYMCTLDIKLKNYEYQQEDGKEMFTMNCKLLGIKKSGADLLWIKQILEVGDLEKDNTKEVLENSKQISYLNPYFLGNYYFTGTILAFIKKYNRTEEAMGILEKGINYNPNDKYLRNYLAGILAYTKGDEEQVINSFRDIAEKYNDPVILNVLASIYESKYKNTNNIDYLNKAIYYWQKIMLSSSGDYTEKAKIKLNLYLKI